MEDGTCDLLEDHVKSDLYDVIVVGAGISGLTAAYEVLKKVPNAKLIVLEAKGKVRENFRTAGAYWVLVD